MKRKKPPNDASILATFVLPIAKALRLLGADPMAILEQAQIDPAHLLNADPTFGLLAAEQLTPAALHGLGFSEPSTFSRVFKRWTHQALADYRRSLEETV